MNKDIGIHTLPKENENIDNKPVSYIRLFHASPDAPPVNIVANGGLIAKDLPYKSFTHYIKVFPGNYNIKIFPHNNMSSEVLNTNIKIPPYSILTLAVGDNLSNLKLFIVPDNTQKVIPNKALVRFANLSPNAGNTNVSLASGIPLFKDVGFGEYTNYTELPPGVYHFKLKSKNTGTELSVPNANLKPGKAYTIYAVGEPSKKAPHMALIPLDGNSYIKF